MHFQFRGKEGVHMHPNKLMSLAMFAKHVLYCELKTSRDLASVD